METKIFLWMIPVTVALHGLEEAVMISFYLPVVNELVPGFLRGVTSEINVGQVLLALMVVTAVPFFVAIFGDLEMEGGLTSFFLIGFQVLMALNAVVHVWAGLMVRGYTPGLVTAVGLIIPFSIYFLRRVYSEQWIDRSAMMILVVAALVAHTVGLIVLLTLTAIIAGIF